MRKYQVIIALFIRFIHCVDDFEFEVFRIVLIRHVAGDDTLEKIFVNASGCDMVDDGLHALHEAIGVPIVAVMDEEPYADSQSNTFIGVLEIMSGT